MSKISRVILDSSTGRKCKYYQYCRQYSWKETFSMLFCRWFCKLRLILEGCVLAGAIYFVSTFKLFLIILTYTPCISMLMIWPNDKRILDEMNVLFTVFSSLIGRCLSFFQAAIKSKCSGKEAKQRTSFRCFFTGFRFKSKVDLQDRVYLDYVPCDKIVKFVFVISQRKTQVSNCLVSTKLALTLVVFEEAVSCIASL